MYFHNFTFRPGQRFGLALFLACLLSFSFIPLTYLAGDSSDYSTVPLVYALSGANQQTIQCIAGYTATVYAAGLTQPDGLAFGSDNLLYVVEETAGRVSRLSANGLTATVVLSGLVSPEGIAFDSSGTMFVTEDIKGGRVVARNMTGVTQTLAAGLDSPEGIVWVDDGSPDGILYVTEQNLEYALSISSVNASDYRTHVTAIPSAGTKNRIVTTTAVFTPNFLTLQLDGIIWSYAGITYGPDRLLYFTNELSGQAISGAVDVPPFGQVMYDFGSKGSIFSLDPTAPAPATEVAAGLDAPEGLRFANTGFPLYVAQEETSDGSGRLSQVDAEGNTMSLCTGFVNIEDVIVGPDGRLYVSGDPTGNIIAIEMPPEPDLAFIWLPLILGQ